jgi:hypothetical protein
MKATTSEIAFAKDMVRWWKRALDELDRGGKAADNSAEQCRVFEQFDAYCSWIGRHLILCGPKVLRLVAKVLDGKKLRGAPHDDLLMKAYEKALRTGRRKRERQMRIRPIMPDGLPFFSEVDGVLAKLMKPPRLTERHVRRRLKKLNRGLSKESPARRKAKPKQNCHG